MATTTPKYKTRTGKENRKKSSDTTAHKAKEAGELIAEIGKLQTETAKTPSDDKESITQEQIKLFSTRLAELELQQKGAQQQIVKLTEAKAKLERARLQSQGKESKQQQAQQKKLQQELTALIKEKEAEFLQIKKEIGSLREQAEQESTKLRVERDAARALVEPPQQTGKASDRGSRPVIIGIAALVLLIGAAAGTVWFFFPDLLPSGWSPLPESTAKAEPKAVTTAGQGSITDEVSEEAEEEIVESYKLPVALGTFQDPLKSGGKGPAMVKVRGGSFLMGARPHHPYPKEHPQTEVTVRDFAIARYETTIGEYQRFVKAAGHKRPNYMGWTNPRMPVINVSWEDAAAYAQWLSRQTNHLYRLPSEREWEYAAGAGADTYYWWGKKFEANRAVCAGCGTRWDSKQPAPVDSLQPNSLGLYHTAGNVREWVKECLHKNYRKMPPEGQSWEGGDCSRHMIRGGSFRTYQKALRTTHRKAYPSKARSDDLGFRVMRVD
ncbi:MAG: SUMF1/EgtB/PvdO family nonheme iron enzyme [Gammaproteobacteria bacterium]|nr:SUMF1/EgtB/PvdO family nonheme iron enzyme [Gammaproteobacteria bacterium]